MIILHIYLNIKNNENKMKEIVSEYKYENIKPQIKTGDIILMSLRKYSSRNEKFQHYVQTIFAGEKYAHVGIIIRKNNKLYTVRAKKIPYKLVIYDITFIINNFLNSIRHTIYYIIYGFHFNIIPF